MAFWHRWFPPQEAPRVEPRAATQSSGGGVLITSPEQLDDYLRGGTQTGAGVAVTPDTAMRVAAVYACVRIRSGVVATLPLDIKRRVDVRTREDADTTNVAQLLQRRPNRWQTPSQFKRMLHAHTMLRGNGYAMIVWSRGEPLQLIPMHPDQVRCEQRDDLSLSYTYTRRDGRQVPLVQREVFHLVGLTLDGVLGVSPITYARETIGLALAQERAGAGVFKNGARASLVLEHPQKLGEEGRNNLRASIDEYRAGGELEGKALILEEGMKIGNLAMTAEDAQWIESRKFSRGDIAMFFGVPPHMIGDTEKSTSWGSGIEQQTQGFLTFTAEDDLTMWQETISRDLITEPKLYARFNRAALVRGDIKTRWLAYQAGRRMKVLSANDIRALEDLNPIDGGDVYENPEITVAEKEESDEPASAA